MEYEAGRYLGEPPVPFVNDIISSAARLKLLDSLGVYVGCGNGRNYLPLVDAGLDLTRVDVSETAIQELARREPERAKRLVHGDLTALPAGVTYGMVIGIQVFQHGDRATCHEHILAAQRLVAPGGLMVVRVNAVGTDIEFDHDFVESDEGAGFTIRYLQGPKRGLLVHFFERSELETLFADSFDIDLPIRVDSTKRRPPGSGQWSQWEAIWTSRIGIRPKR